MRFKKLSDLIRHEETGKERQKSFLMPFSTISKKFRPNQKPFLESLFLTDL